MIRRNPEKIRRELVEAFANPNKLDLEKILFLLYNPSGGCQKCEYAGEFWDCECNKCLYEDEDIINEPCNNFSFCVCDYFDGEPTQEQVNIFIDRLYQDELTLLEKEYQYNATIELLRIQKESVDHLANNMVRSSMIIVTDRDEWLNVSLSNIKQDLKSYNDYLNLSSKFILGVERDKDIFIIIDTIFDVIDNYMINTRVISKILKQIESYDIDKFNLKYLKYLLNKIKKYKLNSSDNNALEELEEKL